MEIRDYQLRDEIIQNLTLLGYAIRVQANLTSSVTQISAARAGMAAVLRLAELLGVAHEVKANLDKAVLNALQTPDMD